MANYASLPGLEHLYVEDSWVLGVYARLLARVQPSRSATPKPQPGGDIDVDAFLSHRITLDEVNEGFDLMHDQDGIRSVIEFG